MSQPEYPVAASPKLEAAFASAFGAARLQFDAGDYAAAFASLERAHILGQRRLRCHLAVHAWMLRVGFAARDRREVIGQIWRPILTPLGHATGRLPIGNTGRANVSAFAPMPIPQDLKPLLEERSG